MGSQLPCFIFLSGTVYFHYVLAVNFLLCRVQQESSDGAERNRFLVNYVDYTFDDIGGQQTSVYPGLCTVWGSLARSKVR